MEMTGFRKWLIFVVGYFETFLFSGILYGWPSLVYLFKIDSLFGHLCSNVTILVHNNTDSITFNFSANSELKQVSCYEEDSMYNLAFSIGTCLLSVSVMSGALILDYFGLRVTRVITNVILFASYLLFALCNKDRPYFLLCGVVLLGLGGGQLRLIDLQVADIFPKTKATVIALYSGAYTGSAVVFLLFKVAAEYGMTWNVSFYCFSALSLLMMVPTFTLFPSKRFSNVKDSQKQKPAKNVDAVVDEKTPILLRSESKHEKDLLASHRSIDKSVEWMNSLPLTDSLTSFSYIIHVYSVSIACLLVMLYNGSFNTWIGSITRDPQVVSDTVELFGGVQVLMVVIGPVIGTMMDSAVNKANKVTDAFDRRKKRQKAGFWALMLTFTAIVALLICMLFKTILVARISIFIYLLCRSMSIACQPAYIRVRFPQHHFNVLTGISGLAVGLQGLIEYFFFLWINTNPLPARLTLLVMVMINFLSPFHLLCLPVKQRSG